MKPLALVPLIFSAGALVLGFLCIFAGYKPGFMQDYSILLVNTSQIGSSLVTKYINGGQLSGILSNLPSSLVQSIETEAQDVASSLARKIGVADFYVAHTTVYCQGYYVPGPIPNATLKASDIKMNVTNCTSLGKADFVPGDAIQDTLNRSGTGITLADLDWNSEIDDKVRQYQKYVKAFLILYAIGVGFAFFTLALSLVWLVAGHRGVAAAAGVCSLLAFLAIGIASALVTAVYVLGVDAINKYGKEVGLQANTSKKMLAISWAGTACALIAMLFGFCGICVGARKNRVAKSQY